MKVDAYRCDYCNEIKESAEVMGVTRTVDIFNKINSYPVINFPGRTDVHYCMTCYNKHVASVADREVNRKKDEEGYKLRLTEMRYNLASQCIANYDKKMFQKSCRGEK